MGREGESAFLLFTSFLPSCHPHFYILASELLDDYSVCVCVCVCVCVLSVYPHQVAVWGAQGVLSVLFSVLFSLPPTVPGTVEALSGEVKHE